MADINASSARSAVSGRRSSNSWLWNVEELSNWLSIEGNKGHARAIENLQLLDLDGKQFLGLTKEDLMESEDLELDEEEIQEVLQLRAKLEDLEHGRGRCGAQIESDGADGSTWTVTCVSVDSQGKSFFGEKLVPLGRKGDIGTLSELIPGTGVKFRETPSDYDFDFHTAPSRQFVVNLDAAVDIEVSNGSRRVFPAGSVMFLEDTWGQGHRSRAVGGEPRRSLFLPVLNDVMK